MIYHCTTGTYWLLLLFLYYLKCYKYKILYSPTHTSKEETKAEPDPNVNLTFAC